MTCKLAWSNKVQRTQALLNYKNFLKRLAQASTLLCMHLMINFCNTLKEANAAQKTRRTSKKQQTTTS